MNHYRGACAVGVWGLEGYAHRAFLELCRKDANLVPIAGFFPESASAIGGELQAIRETGYRGIKIHPRDPRLDLRDPRLVTTFQAAARLELPIFLCTYFHSTAESYPAHDPLYDIAALLQKAPGARVLLVHGGDVNLLRYAELVRFNPRLLLDLSMTFMKYQGSSLDLDIRFLFERFDKRICIGTDFPEYTHQEVWNRFVEMSKGLAREKAENIGFRNIEDFLKHNIGDRFVCVKHPHH
jgi:predicted TIM-barrel fold metal-dependent hydrolase